MPLLQVFTLAGPGGIEESTGDPQLTSYLQNKNTIIYRGRIALRAPIFEVDDLDNSGAGPVDAIIGMTVYLGKLLCACYDDSLDEVNLVQIDLDGTGMIHKAVIWTSVTSQPTAAIMQSFTAGTSTSSESRLYIADFDQTFETRYWNNTTMTTVTSDFNVDAASEDVVFSFIKEYAFHLWGTGFIEGTTVRPEYLRYSTPGAIPLTDIADGNDKDWHVTDHLEIGRRGNPIVGLDVINGRLIVYQQDATHSIAGFSRDTWTVQVVNPNIGAVGPLAFDHYAGVIGFFWGPTGPYMTDGTQVTDIGEAIRKSVNEVPSDTGIIVVVDPVTVTAYFFVPRDGSSSPNYYYAYDIQNQKWTEGQFLDSAGDPINIGVGTRVVELGSAAAGPAAAPNSLTAIVEPGQEDFGMDLDWVNGDTALGVTTEVHRDTSSSFSMTPSTLQDTVGSGVTHFEGSGAANTQYYWKVRHIRNGQPSAGSNEPTVTTHYAKQASIFLSTIVNGLKVHTTHPSTGQEIDIERQTQGSEDWDAIVTLNNQTAGPITYDDTSGTCGVFYRYRTRTHESTVRPSPWIEVILFAEACTNPPFITSFVATASAPNPLKPWLKQVTLDWIKNDYTTFDRTRVYKADPTGSGYILKATTSNNTWTDPTTRNCPGADLVDYRVEAWDENTSLSDTDSLPITDPCAIAF